MSAAGALRLVLGDQISDGRLSALRDLDPRRDVVLMAEVREEATYVRHHKQKIALVFAGMRGFAARLRAKGIAVRYVGYEDPGNAGSLVGEVLRTLKERPRRLPLQPPLLGLSPPPRRDAPRQPARLTMVYDKLDRAGENERAARRAEAERARLEFGGTPIG